MLRLICLSLLFAVELTLLSLAADGASLLAGSGEAARMLGRWGMPVAHFLVSLVALSAAFAWLGRRTAVLDFARAAAHSHLNFRFAALHGAAFAALMVTGRGLYAPAAGRSWVSVAVFLAAGIATGVFGLAAVLPLGRWRELARSIGSLWLWAGASAFAAVWMTGAWRSLWQPASALTYWLVQMMLRPFIGRLIVEPENMRIATGRFGVIISPECSGLEGMGLLLLFTLAWLWLNRKDCRFPQALLLIPAGLVTLFLLNSVRIAALLLIGHAGAREIAAQGFHSQAGWIAFNGVAFGLSIIGGRIPWITVGKAPVRAAPANAVAVYLMPFLAVVAAGMVSRATTGAFEWMYPLRVVAGGAALWVYRREYRKMSWSITWQGPAIGLLVFAVWVAMVRPLPAPVPAALAAAAPFGRWMWIALRALGASCVVPIAEELAFRGYLMRRFRSEEFTQLAPSSAPLWALLASSLLFGAMHGSHWLAGTVAGCAYALVYRHSGRLGNSIAAHAVTNGLIAATVVTFNAWALW